MDVDRGLKINLSRREIRIRLLIEFRLVRTATKATNNICNIMGGMYSLSVRTTLLQLL